MAAKAAGHDLYCGIRHIVNRTNALAKEKGLVNQCGRCHVLTVSDLLVLFKVNEACSGTKQRNSFPDTLSRGAETLYFGPRLRAVPT